MLINREDLLKDLEETVVFSGREGHVSAEMRGANKVISRIKAAPTIEVYKSQCVKDLVDRATVLRVVCEGCNAEFSEEPCEPDSCAIKIMLEGLPTVTLDDIRPKGRWECVYDENVGTTDVTCSHCKDTRTINGCYVTVNGKSCYFEDSFCPSCGAKMK